MNSMTTHSLPVVENTSGLTEEQRKDIAGQLAALIDGEVRFGRHDRMLYSTDASIYQIEPIGVVVPRTISDVEIIIRFCAENNLPVLPRGGGTALAGQSVNAAVIIDFSAYCNRIGEIDIQQRSVEVEPGVVLDHLNAALAEHNLMFGPDVATAAHANLGGMIGNNSAGAHSILYGRTVDHLLSVDVLMPDGMQLTFCEGASERNAQTAELTKSIAELITPLADEIRSRYPRTRRRVNGYNLELLLDQIETSTQGTYDKVNLAHLICGSEGTLCTVISAKLKLVPRPATKCLAIAGFHSVDEALAALQPILATNPAAVELVDDTVIDLARRNVEYRHYVDLMPLVEENPPGAVLYVEYSGDTRSQLEEKLNELESTLPGIPIKRFTDDTMMSQAWKLRKAGEPLLHGLPGKRKPITFVEDTAVDPARLAAFVKEFREIVAGHGSRAAYYAHASVGCLHIRPLINLHDPDDLNLMQRIAEDVTELVKRYGGALSGEHGDGRVRSPLLEQFYGKPVCDLFAAIKSIFDPQNRMNPGNITAPKPMVDHLRVRPADQFVRIPPVDTYFEYKKEDGFEEAIKMCNGAGVCRKTKGGTMCPSYRGTRDERHATRGRGNALRLAISGQFTNTNTPAWNDPGTIETLDLCLSCKACKSECPSNVDITKLKSEYAAQRYKNLGRVPLQTQAFGRIRALNKLGSLTHPIANALNNFKPVHALMTKLLKIDSRRSIPRFERSLYTWFRQRGGSKNPSNEPTVVLFPDCFTVYNEPHIGKSSVRVLESLGYHVVLPKLGCCGRSMMSVGMLAEATETCRATARALLECVAGTEAVAVVGCEPSCISAIKDEWLELKSGIDSSSLTELAAKSFLIEEFIDINWKEHPNQVEHTTTNVNQDVILHGHCHQKALWGVESSSNALRRVYGDRLTAIDSGCCGMAGSFGYMADHYDLSMQIGELSVFPPIRAAPDTIITAPGTSCRHQIHDGTSRKALHPIELLEDALAVK